MSNTWSLLEFSLSLDPVEIVEFLVRNSSFKIRWLFNGEKDKISMLDGGKTSDTN